LLGDSESISLPTPITTPLVFVDLRVATLFVKFEFIVKDDDVYEDDVELEKFLRRLLVRLLFVETEVFVSSSSVSSSVVLLVFNKIFNSPLDCDRLF
jgi:hypothetical protein